MSGIFIDTNERKERRAVYKEIERMRVWGIISRDEANRRKSTNDGFVTFLETTNILLPKIRATLK